MTVLKCLLEPVTPATNKNTLIFILFKLNEEIMKRFSEIEESQRPKMLVWSRGMEIEILEALLFVYKELAKKIEQFADDIQKKAEEDRKYPHGFPEEEHKNSEEKEKEKPFNELFQEPSDGESGGLTGFRESLYVDSIESQKDQYMKQTRNLILCISAVIDHLRKMKGQEMDFEMMKLMQKLLIRGSKILQYVHEILPEKGQQIGEVIKDFSSIFFKMNPLQFRDLFESSKDQFFDFVLEVKAKKGEIGVCLLTEQFMYPLRQTQQMPQPSSNDDHAIYFLEILFKYVSKKIKIFGEGLPAGHRLSHLPTADLHEALQKLIQNQIVERALGRINNTRLKHQFFSLFIYCINYTKNFEIIPNYFSIIRSLFKSLANLPEKNTFLKEFIPLIQGLLETFLQAKDEAMFIKESNEICYTVPARLKNLIEYLPIISKPLIDSMKSSNIELIESGLNTIQMWICALAPYPEILDPVIAPVLPEFNSLLYKFLYLLPNFSFKLLGKLGAKSRLYYEEKEFKSKN